MVLIHNKPTQNNRSFKSAFEYSGKQQKLADVVEFQLQPRVD